MFPPNYIGMNIPAGPVPVNGSEVRGRTFSTKKNYSRDTSMSSTWSSIIYHERMANNGMDVDPEPANNFLLCSTRWSRRKHYVSVK